MNFGRQKKLNSDILMVEIKFYLRYSRTLVRFNSFHLSIANAYSRG